MLKASSKKPAAVANASLAGASTQPGITIKDDCDQTTFNADPPTGPGIGVICTKQGTTTFQSFIDQLTANHSATGWEFSPGTLAINSGQSLTATNAGGETHTFTEVASFGDGSIAPPINDLLGASAAAPECIADATGVQATFIAAGGTRTVSNLAVGVHRFQDCIHPWMRTTITVVS